MNDLVELVARLEAHAQVGQQYLDAGKFRQFWIANLALQIVIARGLAEVLRRMGD